MDGGGAKTCSSVAKRVQTEVKESGKVNSLKHHISLKLALT